MVILGTILAFVIGLSPITQPTVQSILEDGLKKKQSGDYIGALETWEQARIVLEEPSLAIALEYIQLTTEANITSSYQVASAMYQWGISEKKPDSDLIELEMNRLEPIVPAAQFKEWKKVSKRKKERVLPLIEQFWLSEDLTPSTPYNERLLEHWERIAHARKHFTLNDESVYGTDDRGISWVQFGKPAYTFDGILTLEPATVTNVVVKRLGINGPIGENERAYARAMENAILGAVSPALEYEVWVYTSHDIDSYYSSNNVIMFGETPLHGFAKALTVNDFIAPELFTFSQRFAVQTATGTIDFGITPAVIVQHEYLKQLAGVDPIFGRAYGNLLNDFFRAGEPPRKDQALRYQREQVLAAKDVENAAPQEASTYLDEFPAISIDTYAYRFLDDENKPYALTYVESNPLLPFITDVKYNEDSVFTEDTFSENPLSYYSYTHGLQIRNKEWELLASQKLYPPINVDIEESNPKTVSIFTIPFVSEDTWLVYSAELKNNHPKSKPSVASIFPEKVRGLGSEKLQQTLPLNVNEKEIELSDIVFGYDLDEESDSVFIPFTVSHTREIPRNEQLAFHYEVYHLKADRNGIRKIQVDLEIKERLGFIQRLTNDTSRYTLTLNQDTDESSFRENLELVTADLEEGDYTLRIKITDTISKQTIEKEIDFEIIQE